MASNGYNVDEELLKKWKLSALDKFMSECGDAFQYTATVSQYFTVPDLFAIKNLMYTHDTDRLLKMPHQRYDETKDDEKCSYEENVALALETYRRMSAQFVPNLDWSIKIYLYHNFVITESGEISNSKIDHTVHLRDDDSSNIITLHMDCRAFIDAINRKLSWNQLISGSHAMIERQPNIYNPDVLFSLNFFRI